MRPPMLQKHIALAIRHAIDLCNMLIGYARVSTNEQDAAAQVQALMPPAARSSSAKKRQVGDGIARNCIACLDKSARAMSSWSGSSTASRAR